MLIIINLRHYYTVAAEKHRRSGGGNHVHWWRRIPESALEGVGDIGSRKLEADQDADPVRYGLEPNLGMAVVVKPRAHSAHSGCKGGLADVRVYGPHSAVLSEGATRLSVTVRYRW